VRILIAFDNSSASREAMKFALKLKPIVDEYLIVYVTPTVVGAGPTFDSYVPPSVYVKQEESADKVLKEAKDFVESEKINARYLQLDSSGDQVANVMVRAAKENNVDLIVTGTRKLSGLSKVLLGSVSSELVKLSRIPVLVAPPPE